MPLARRPNLAGDLALRVAAGQVLPLVVGLLAAGQRQLHLDLALGEVQRQRHQCQVAVADLADQVVDLLAVQQQLAVAPRRVVGPAAVVILGDVQVAQPDLAVVDGGERVGQRRLAVAQALHLGADQRDPGLEGLEDRIVVPRFAIGRDDLVVAGPRRVGFLRHG